LVKNFARNVAAKWQLVFLRYFFDGIQNGTNFGIFIWSKILSKVAEAIWLPNSN
jgi:hypothetical protein